MCGSAVWFLTLRALTHAATHAAAGPLPRPVQSRRRRRPLVCPRRRTFPDHRRVCARCRDRAWDFEPVHSGGSGLGADALRDVVRRDRGRAHGGRWRCASGRSARGQHTRIAAITGDRTSGVPAGPDLTDSNLKFWLFWRFWLFKAMSYTAPIRSAIGFFDSVSPCKRQADPSWPPELHRRGRRHMR